MHPFRQLRHEEAPVYRLRCSSKHKTKSHSAHFPGSKDTEEQGSASLTLELGI